VPLNRCASFARLHIHRTASLWRCIIVEHSQPLPSISSKCPHGSRFQSPTIATDARAADVARVHAAHRDRPVSRVLMHPMDCPVKSVTLEHPEHRQAKFVNRHKYQINAHARQHPDRKVHPDREVNQARAVMLAAREPMDNQADPVQWAHQASPVAMAIPELVEHQVDPVKHFQAVKDHPVRRVDPDLQVDLALADHRDHLAAMDNRVAQAKWDHQDNREMLDNREETANRVNLVAVAVAALAIIAHRLVSHRDTKQSVGYKSMVITNNNHLLLDNNTIVIVSSIRHVTCNIGMRMELEIK